MDKVSEPNEYRWIDDATRRRHEQRLGGLTVGHYLPPTFESYAKIFHPIYRNQSANESQTWEDLRHERSLLSRLKSFVGKGDRIEEYLATGLVGDTLVGVTKSCGDPENRITWRKAAEECGIAFDAAIDTDTFLDAKGSWPAKYYYPAEGDLGQDCLEELASAIARHDNCQRCYFYYDEFSWHTQGCTAALYVGSLTELGGWASENEYSTPSLWWPETREWCVCCDIDRSFTLLAGNSELVFDIVKNDLLEAVAVDVDHRI